MMNLGSWLGISNNSGSKPNQNKQEKKNNDQRKHQPKDQQNNNTINNNVDYKRIVFESLQKTKEEIEKELKSAGYCHDITEKEKLYLVYIIYKSCHSEKEDIILSFDVGFIDFCYSNIDETVKMKTEQSKKRDEFVQVNRLFNCFPFTKLINWANETSRDGVKGCLELLKDFIFSCR